MMILSELKRYLQSHSKVALRDIALHFKTDPDAIRGMLQQWQSKGRVEKLPAGTACGGGCCQCDPATLEIYAWRG